MKVFGTDINMNIYDKAKAHELTIEELFPRNLTDTVCINIDGGRQVWVATLMCAEYLDTFIDSIVVRDDDFKPVGIVGGLELLGHLQKNPTRDFQYSTRIEEIMLRDLPQIEKKTKLRDLMQIWKNSGRAFAIILNEFGDCSTISARKLVEVGTKCKTDILISSMPKKGIITFKRDATLGEILDLMFKHKTRKLLLEDTNEFISDRLILGEISKILRFQTDIDYFLDIPSNRFSLENAEAITEELRFDQVCSIMKKMDNPLVVYKDTVFTPWDVCLTLSSEDLITPLEIELDT
jgi:CBS domain-containing protein